MGRVQSIVSRVNQRLTIQLAAGLLAGSTLLSSFLGLYRDRLLNSMYHSTYPVGLDAYTAAFTIPDFMFYILVSGALGVTFIPVFTQRLSTGNRKSSWELSSSMINFMALTTLAASILIIIFANQLVYIVSPGLNESGHELAASMMRVIAVNPFLFAIGTVLASMQQAIGRYTFFALAPMIYNIGIIIGATFFTNPITIFGHTIFGGGIMGVALGVALGSILQLIISAIGLIGVGFDYQFKIYWKNQGFRKVIRILPARSIDQAMDYIVGIFEFNMASRMGEGMLRAYQQATVLHSMPINLVGVAISTAAFPSMSETIATGNIAKFRHELQQVIRVIIWIALPIATLVFFTRGYVVSFIFKDGNAIVAGVLGALVGAILFRSIYHIAARAFYVQQDTKTPLYISIFSIALNIGLALLFIYHYNMGLYGLAFAQSIVAFVEVVILFAVIQRRLPGGLFDRRFIDALFRMASAAGGMSVIAYIMVQIFQLQSSDESMTQTLPKFLIIIGVSGLVYLGLSRMMRLSEANPVIDRIRSLLFNQRSV